MILPILMLVMDGNRMNFINHLRKKQNIPLITIFTAEWCPHCKKLLPIFQKVAENYKDNERITFSAIDCANEDDLCSKFDISSYPTFILGIHNITIALPYLNSKDRLRTTIDRIFTLNSYNFSNKPTRFPNYEFTLSQNDKNSRDIVDAVILALEIDFDQISINEKQLQYTIEPKVTANIDKGLSVESTDQFTPFFVKHFIEQNSLKIFDYWTFKSIKTLDKRVAILLTNNPRDYEKYRSFAHKYYNKFVFLNSAGVRHTEIPQKYWNISASDLPAFIIMDSKATYYSALRRINNSKKMAHYEGLIDRDVLVKNYFKIDPREFNKRPISIIKINIILILVAIVVAILIVEVCGRCDNSEPNKHNHQE